MNILSDKEIKLPSGYTFCGFFSGFKKCGDADTAMICCPGGAQWAGVFTRNRVKAHCVVRNEQLLDSGGVVKAIIANSGNANACTGKAGEDANQALAREAAQFLGCEADEVLTASTGVIGVPLPTGLAATALEKGLGTPAAEPDRFLQAAEAIMTTDTVRKTASVSFSAGGRQYTLSGMTKGSGMIHPNMGTMLAFLCTDFPLPPSLLQSTLKLVVDDTFNMISVDGDTSTNDMVLLLSPAETYKAMSEGSDDIYPFRSALHALCEYLAVSIAADGEGAGKLLRCSVSGASNLIEARRLAKGVIGSSLVKCAFFGEDANWGRIIAAMGYSGSEFDPDGVSIAFCRFDGSGEIHLMEEGSPVPFSEEDAAKLLGEKEIEIRINLHDGSASARAWGCDLSYEYVKINGDYRT